MYFSICNEFSINKYSLKGNKSILIRVLEPSYKIKGIPYKINNIDDYSNILELYIDDTILEFGKTNKENLFNYEKALTLNNFILENDFDEVVVHCSLGISRSPAIMICVAKILNNLELENKIKEKYKYYNQYIVRIFQSFNYQIKYIELKDIKGNITEEKNTINKDFVLELKK